MEDLIRFGDIEIQYKKKEIKNIHLSVHPPNGKVTLVVPKETRLEVAKAYAISKLSWIRHQKKLFLEQTRENYLKYEDHESHFLWGRRYLLSVNYSDKKSFVKLDDKKIILTVKSKSSRKNKEKIVQEWYRSKLHEQIPSLINKWQEKMGVKVNKYYLQKMKTRWGSCNPISKNIRLNTELAKKPKNFLEYVLVHELAHLLEPTHNENFINILNKFYPYWKEARKELNELPIGN